MPNQCEKYFTSGDHDAHDGHTAEETRWVEVWCLNDSDVYFAALDLAQDGDVDGLAEMLTTALTTSAEGTAAWHTGQEMSANDYNRVCWAEIADTLTAD